MASLGGMPQQRGLHTLREVAAEIRQPGLVHRPILMVIVWQQRDVAARVEPGDRKMQPIGDDSPIPRRQGEGLGRRFAEGFGIAGQLKPAADSLVVAAHEDAKIVHRRPGDGALRGQINSFLEAFRADGGFEKLGDEFLSEEKAAFKAQGIPFYF